MIFKCNQIKTMDCTYLLIAKITIRAMSRRMIGIMMPTRNVVLSGSVVISADQLDSLNISLVVYALILNLNNFMKYHYWTLHYKTCFNFLINMIILEIYSLLTCILFQVSKGRCNNPGQIGISEYQRWNVYWSNY